MPILGNRKSILGGSSATWQYGPSGELTDVRNASFTGATISRYAYTYDATLRRTAVAKSDRAFATEDDISYGYNYRSELTNATAQADSAYRYAYDFDDIGNRKTSAERTAPSVSYTANSLNQYTAIDDFVPTYDADGNQTLVKTKAGIWHVTYNGENRPVRWECGTNIITMTYDRMGRRISKNDQTFIYDGYLQIADNRGSCYIWDPTEPVATRPLVRNNSEFYFHDGNKNVSEVVDDSGTLIAHYDYAPFGDCTAVCSNPWRFSSEYSDDDLGLIYYNYRHYDPVTGRWLSTDPVGTVSCVNLYNCAYNNLMSIYDVFGLAGDVTHGTKRCLKDDSCCVLLEKYKLWIYHFKERFQELKDDKYNLRLFNIPSYNRHIGNLYAATTNLNKCLTYMYEKCKNGDNIQIKNIPKFDRPKIPEPIQLPLSNEICFVPNEKRRWNCSKIMLGGAVVASGVATVAMAVNPFDGPIGECACSVATYSLYLKFISY